MKELNKLKQELLIMKTENIKPNYSELVIYVNVKIKTDSSAIYLISIVEEPFVLINQSYIFHT